MAAPLPGQLFVACNGTLTQTGDAIECSGSWISYDIDDIKEYVGDIAGSIDRLTDVLEYLFTFDPELFGIVLFGCALIFAKGWGAGVVMRWLSKSH